jgi:addiction module RelE/StbE family toxin
VKVAWTDQALSRLGAIREYVAQDSPTAALRLVTSLVERGDSLSRLSRRGRLLPGHEARGIREVLEGNYRIVYRVRADVVEILTVFERHRLLPEEDLW